MCQAVPLSGRGIEEVLANLTFDLGRQALLRRGVGGTEVVGVGEEGREERGFSVSERLRPPSNIIFVKRKAKCVHRALGTEPSWKRKRPVRVQLRWGQRGHQ